MWVSRWLKLHHVFLVYLQLTFLSTLEQQGDYFREGQWSERSLIANAPLDCFRNPIWHTPLCYCTNASSSLCNANTPLCSSSARLHTRQTLWNDGLDMRGAKKKLFWWAMALTEEVAHNGSLQNLCDRLKFCQVELKWAVFRHRTPSRSAGEVICTTLELRESAKSTRAAGSPAVRDAEKKKMKDSVHF